VNQYDSFGYAPIHIAILCAEQLARKRRRSKAVEMASDQEKKKVGYSQASPKVTKLASTDFDLASATTVSDSVSKRMEMSKRESMMEESTNAIEQKLNAAREPLEMADFGMLTLILAAGADVDKSRRIITTNEVVASPLFEAVVMGESELVRNVFACFVFCRYLAYRFFSIYLTFPFLSKHPILFFFLTSQKVRCLLEYGANPNKLGRSRDRSYPEPPLHVAARRECEVQVYSSPVHIYTHMVLYFKKE
jgi:hypothetical protein